jgi:glucose-1-phosphate cytidylyltransferase
MQVVILCGGKGTRMADAHYDAKALVEIGGRPILWHIMKIYAAYGHKEFVLTLGHGAASIKRYFLDYEPMTRDITLCLGERPDIYYHQGHEEDGWQITMVDTGLETNKGSRLRHVLGHTNGQPFHVTYGDGVGNVNINELQKFHQAHGKLATITTYQPLSQYGIVQFGEDGVVTGFEEKPLLDDWINAGFMIFEPGVAGYLDSQNDLDLEKEVLVNLARDRQLVVYQHKGFWRSMDTFKEAREMDRLWSDSAPWKVWS